MIAGTIEIQMLADMARLQADMNKAQAMVGGAMDAIKRNIEVATTALSAFGAVTTLAGFGELISKTIEATANLYKLSLQTGVTVESLSALRGVAKLSGTDMGDVATAMQKLSKNMVDAQSGTGKAADTFRSLGVSVTDGQGKLKTADQVMLELAKSMQGFEHGAGLTTAQMNLLGKAGANLGAFLAELAEKGVLNAKVTTEQAKQAHEFEQAQIRLQMAVQGVAKSIASELIPVIMKLPGLMQPIINLAVAWVAGFIVLPAVITAVGAAFTTMAVGVYEGTTALMAMDAALAASVTATQAAVVSFGLLKSSMAFLMAAYAGWAFGTWLRENFVEAQIAGNFMVNFLLKGWEDIKYYASVAFEFIKTEWIVVFEGMGTVISGFMTKVAGGLSSMGMDGASAKVLGWANSVKTATTSSTTFTERLAALSAQHVAAKAGIDAITEDMDKEAYAHFAVAKAAEVHLKVLKGVGDAVDNKELTAYLALMKGITEKNAVVVAELATTEKLTGAEQESAKIKALLLSGELVLTAAHKAAVLAALELYVANDKLKASRDADQAAIAKYTAATQSNLEKLREEADIYKLTPLALQQISAARAIDKAASDAIYKVKLDMNGEDQKTNAASAEMITKILARADADKQATRFLIDKNEAQKLSNQLEKETVALAVNNTVYIDETARQTAELEKKAKAWRDQIDAIKEEGPALDKLRADYQLWYAEAQKGLDTSRLTSAWQAVDSAAHTAFTNIFQNGKDAFTQLRDTLSSTLLDLLYQMTVKKWVFEIFADVTGSGSGGSGVAGAVTGGKTGIMGLINGGRNANSIYDYGSKAYNWMFGGAESTSGTAGQAAIYSDAGYTGELGGAYSGAGAATTNTAIYSDLGYTGGEVASGAATTGTGAAGLEAGAASMGPYGMIAAAVIAILASRDATRVQSTGDSRTSFNADGTISNRANALYGGDQPVVIPSIVNGQAVDAPAYHTFNPSGVLISDTNQSRATQDQVDAENAANNASLDSHIGGINANADKYLKSVNDAYLSAAKNLGVGAVATTMGYGSNDSDGGKFRLSTSTANSSFDSGDTKADPGSLTLAANRAILTALEGSDLPKWMKGVFDGVDATNLDQKGIDAAIQKAVDLKTAYNTLGSIPNVNLSGITFETLNDLRGTATQLATVDQAFYTLGYAMLDVSKVGGDAAASLVSAFGTVQQFQTAMSTYFQNYRTTAQQQDQTYQQVQTNLSQVGINYTLDQLKGATRADIAGAVDSAFGNSTMTDAQKAALVNNANTLAPLKGSLDAVAPAATKAADAIGGGFGGGGGGGGGGGATGALDALANAVASLVDNLLKERDRLLDAIKGNGPEGVTQAQMRFAIATAQARAGDQNAAAALPGISQALETLATANAQTQVELNLIRARTANSLDTTASILNGGTVPMHVTPVASVASSVVANTSSYSATQAPIGMQSNNSNMEQLTQELIDKVSALLEPTQTTADMSTKVKKILVNVTNDGDGMKINSDSISGAVIVAAS